MIDRVAKCLLLGLNVIGLGCTDVGDPNRCRLNGTVTLDSQPLADADLQLLAGPKNLLSATGITDNEGNYEMKNIRPGEYKVIIRYPGMAFLHSQLSSQERKPPAPDDGPPARLAPVYSDPKQTQLTVELQAGNQTVDFSLESNP